MQPDKLPHGQGEFASVQRRVHQIGVKAQLRHTKRHAIEQHALILLHRTQIEQYGDLFKKIGQHAYRQPKKRESQKTGKPQQQPVIAQVEHNNHRNKAAQNRKAGENQIGQARRETCGASGETIDPQCEPADETAGNQKTSKG